MSEHENPSPSTPNPAESAVSIRIQCLVPVSAQTYYEDSLKCFFFFSFLFVVSASHCVLVGDPIRLEVGTKSKLIVPSGTFPAD